MVRTYLRMIFFWVYVFFWQRLVLAVLLTPKNFPEGFSWWRIFATSFRFDLMVTAYLLAPLLIIMILPLITGWPRPRYRIRAHRAYLVVMTIAVGAITFFDFAGFAETQDRWNQNWKISELLQSHFFSWPLLGAEICLILLVLYQARRWSHIKMDLAHVTFVRWIVCAIMLFALGRGSIGPHHLDLRFAEISPSVTVQRVVIPSCYAYDQALRDRR